MKMYNFNKQIRELIYGGLPERAPNGYCEDLEDGIYLGRRFGHNIEIDGKTYATDEGVRNTKEGSDFKDLVHVRDGRLYFKGRMSEGNWKDPGFRSALKNKIKEFNPPPIYIKVPYGR